MIFALTAVAIIVPLVLYWNSYSVPLKASNLCFAVICCLWIKLRGFPFILWTYSVLVYLFISLYTELSNGFQVLGICWLVTETSNLCILLLMKRILVFTYSLLPYIGQIKELKFDEKFESPKDMIFGIEAVRSMMFDSLDEVQAVLDSELFDRYIGINGIIAEYLKWTLPEFGDEDEQNVIEEVMDNLVRSRTVDEEQCDIELLSGEGGQYGSTTNMTARLLE